MDSQNIRDIIFEKITSESWQDEIMPLKKTMAFYQCAIMQVETKFNVISTELGLQYDANPIEAIKSRLKSIDSIVKKLQKGNHPINLESLEKNISDVAGVRVICSFEEDIYKLINSLLTHDDVELVKMKDYIKNPKENGYRSVHLIIEIPIFLYEQKKKIKVEVQFRTLAMDFWASLEHKLRYKKKVSQEKLKYVDDKLYECATLCAQMDKNMSNIRMEVRKYQL